MAICKKWSGTLLYNSVVQVGQLWQTWKLQYTLMLLSIQHHMCYESNTEASFKMMVELLHLLALPVHKFQYHEYGHVDRQAWASPGSR